MKLAPALIMLAQGMPFASRLLPLLTSEEQPERARWEQEYAGDRWSYLAGLDEVAHYSVIVGYHAFAKPGGSVLDVGCGEGILQARLVPHGCRRYLGIDFAASAIDAMADRRDATTDFQVADAASFTTDEKFDTIIFNESLYYFADPLAIVRRYQPFLEGDGLMIVSMVMARNRIAIWNTIGAAVETVDETNVFNRAGVGWTVRLLRPASGSSGAGESP